jgi:hypothetical protein
MQSLERHLVEQYKLPSDYFWHDVRWYAVLGLLPPGPITILDVGAGTGRLGAQLACARPDARYRFIEPLTTLEDRLEREFGEAANAGADASATADVVTLLDVIEHEPDDVGFLTSLVSRSAPGTRFILTVPASMLLWSAWDVELGHHRRYTRRTLATTLRTAGLDVHEVAYLFPELWPVALARRVRHPADGADPARNSPEFQPLPRSVNTVLRAVGRLSVRGRHFVPFGTSVLGVGTTVWPDEAHTE